jgi:hypothetical protein
MATVTSKQFTLNARDFLRGVWMAVILPVLATIQTSISNGELTFNWKLIGLTALGSFIAYLIKNFLSPTEIVITPATKEQAEAVKTGEAEVIVQTK